MAHNKLSFLKAFFGIHRNLNYHFSFYYAKWFKVLSSHQDSLFHLCCELRSNCFLLRPWIDSLTNVDAVVVVGNSFLLYLFITFTLQNFKLLLVYQHNLISYIYDYCKRRKIENMSFYSIGKSVILITQSSSRMQTIDCCCEQEKKKKAVVEMRNWINSPHKIAYFMKLFSLSTILMEDL